MGSAYYNEYLTHIYTTISTCMKCSQHAAALELMTHHLKEGKRALDVGCGSGYLTACMGLMVCNFNRIFKYKPIYVQMIHCLVCINY